MGILNRTSKLDELSGKMVETTTYDNSDVLRLNAAQRNEKIDGAQFKADFAKMVHVARIDMGDIERLRNMGYNLLSPDRDEVRRALLYVQSNEPHLLTVNKKPFAKVRNRWV
jgi:hypothetical protein